MDYRQLCVAVAGVILSPSLLSANSIVVYVEPPGAQSSSVAGIKTESFNGFSSQIYSSSISSTIGTYVANSGSQFAVVDADVYGGAGGSGKYFAVGSESKSTAPVLLNLSSEANYFGFWWSAGDPSNAISFLQDGTLLATFTTAQLTALLPKSSSTTVTAINGSVYHTINYYGNPNNNGDTSEPFAYVDVIATGLQFNQVQFSLSSTTRGFESDNHSVASGVTGPPVTDVVVQNAMLTSAAQAPEPATLGMAALGIALALGSRRRRKSSR